MLINKAYKLCVYPNQKNRMLICDRNWVYLSK